jgi:hypothetical protein
VASETEDPVKPRAGGRVKSGAVAGGSGAGGALSAGAGWEAGGEDGLSCSGLDCADACSVKRTTSSPSGQAKDGSILLRYTGDPGQTPR